MLAPDRQPRRPLAPALWLGALVLAASLLAGTRTVQAQITVEADISTRRIAIETDFAGVRIIVFGAISGRPASAIAKDRFDIAVVIEGPRENLVVRRKSNVAGIWINTEGRKFSNVPSYYTIISSHPVQNIASEKLLAFHGIGFDQVKMLPEGRFDSQELQTYKAAVIRLKQDQGLYRREPTGVTFVGDNLFRATVDLPANVSPGHFRAKVFLFRNGAYVTQYETGLNLQREGVERLIHSFAFDNPFLYGVAAVIIAVLAGLAATAVFKRD